jgi:hypothetical protein
MTTKHVPTAIPTSRVLSRHPTQGVVSPRLRKRKVQLAKDLSGASTAGALPNFTYNGGPVVNTPQVFALFVGDWSSAANQTRQTRLTQFITDMLNGQYMNMLAQYGCGTSGTVTAVPISSNDHDLSATDIHTIIQNAINSHVVPDAGPSNAYVLFLDDATAVNDTDAGAVMCEASSDTAFGFHDFFKTAGGANCYFTVVPGLTDTCLKHSCSDDNSCSLHLAQTREQRQTQVLSHELSELLSDPEVSFNEAWTQPSGPHENGDICNGQSGTITAGANTWTVQLMYSKTDDLNSNGSTTCVAGASTPLTSFVRWGHVGRIPAHPLGADVDCSGLPQGARSVTLADVDGDGHAEMVVQIDAAHSGGNDFWVMKFDPVARSWTHVSPIAGHPLQADFDCSGLPQAGRAVAAADVDGDGRAEVVVQIDAAGSGGNDFWVMKFDPFKKVWFHLSPIAGHPLQADFDCSGLGKPARAFCLADVDGDGHAEVIVQIDAAGSGGNDFWVMKFTPETGGWSHLSPIPGHPLQADFDCSSLPQAAGLFAAADVDGDERAEVVLQIDATHSGGNDFWVMKFDLINKVWFHLSPIAGHPLEADFDCSGLANRARSVTLADVDGDRRAEVVVQIDARNSGGNDFWAMKFNPRTRSWAHLSPIPGHPLQADFDCSGLSNAARAVTAGDVDGDGTAEVVLQIDASGSGGHNLWVMKFDPKNVNWSHFSPVPSHPLQADLVCSGVAKGARAVRMADIDGDGRAEVVVQIDATHSGANDFWVMRAL